MSDDVILLDQGSGGRASHRLVSDIFLKYFDAPELAALNDAALVTLNGPCAMSTDSYVVSPIFFPGGDIGSLAVNGTVNDVAMLGARPKYLSCGFILEEGLPLGDLERIVASMAWAARDAGVAIVTGDTKVVPKGAADKIFINTCGVGEILVADPPMGHKAKPGDVVLVSGAMGNHGATILGFREGLNFETNLESDCAALNGLTEQLLLDVGDVHVLRDPTRGGLATTLNEIAQQSQTAMLIEESAVPVDAAVKSCCSFLGLDPLYLANEGKLLCILPEAKAEQALAVLRSHPKAGQAAIIGRVLAPGDALPGGRTHVKPGQCIQRTPLGGHRLLHMLEGEQLPRIC